MSECIGGEDRGQTLRGGCGQADELFFGLMGKERLEVYIDRVHLIARLLDEHFNGQGYRVSLQRKTANKPQYKPDEYESYEIWIAKRTGGATSAQMAAGIINDSKTVLKKLTLSGFPRPGFDNRYVIWHPDDADKPIVDIGEGQTAADGPIFVLDWLALHDAQAKQYAPKIEQEQ